MKYCKRKNTTDSYTYFIEGENKLLPIAIVDMDNRIVIGNDGTEVYRT